MTTESGFLSPSRAWRLTQCPASGQVAGPRTAARRIQRETNAGTLAHDAVELWIKADGYRADDVRASMTRALDEALVEAGGVAPPRWTMVRSRLRARAGELAAAIGAAPGTTALAEERLIDPSLGIEGTPDIVVTGDDAVLIDLKTEDLDSDELSPWVLFQLRIYAHLVRQAYGSLPSRVEVFSTNRGRVPVAISAFEVDLAVDALAAARLADVSETTPALETCRFCARRVVCQPHWDASASWPDRDCVEGQLQRTERADNGLVAARLEGDSELAQVSGIPEARFAAGLDSMVRFVRVNRRPADARHEVWRWTSVSEVDVVN